MAERITIGWDDADDAEAVALILGEAAQMGGGRVDRGFKHDYDRIMRQVGELRAEDAADEVDRGYCPMGCGQTLFLGEGGYVTCSLLECPRPDAAAVVLDNPERSG